MPVPNPLEDLQAYIEAQIKEQNVPALSVAIWHQGKLHKAAAGSLNLETGVEATPDSLFRIASITKVFTASLVMQLVDEGRVDLDKPVKHYLRDFQIADSHATQIITVRHLLNHTNGIAGDFFPDDCHQEGNPIARFIDRCNLIPLVHPVGEMYSYSNTAFAILGRLVEVLRGITWYQAMEEYIFKPLGMHHAIADPKGIIRFRAAMGHIPEQGSDRLTLLNDNFLSLGTAPAGATAAMTAEALISFARAHLEGGVNQSGERWLSEQSVQAMQTPSSEKPHILAGRNQRTGLSWGLSEFQQSGLKLVGHSGAIGGCLSNLQLLPAQNSAFAILTNGYRSSATDAITRDLLLALTGVDNRIPSFDMVEADPDQLQKIAGCYESFDTLIDIDYSDNHLQARVIWKSDPKPPEQISFKATTEKDCLAVVVSNGQRKKNSAFLGPDTNVVPQYLFFGGRISNRL